MLYRSFARDLTRLKIRPAALKVHCRDWRGQAFFGLLADQLKIPLETADSLPALTDLLVELEEPPDADDIEFTESSADEMIRAACSAILSTPLPELRAAPRDPELIQTLLHTNHPAVTPEVRKKLRLLSR